MKKVLRIISISAAIVSAVSAVILGCIYLEDIAGYLKKVKSKIVDVIIDRKNTEDEYDYE